MFTNLELVKNKYYSRVGKYCVSNAGVLRLSGLRPLFYASKTRSPSSSYKPNSCPCFLCKGILLLFDDTNIIQNSCSFVIFDHYQDKNLKKVFTLHQRRNLHFPPYFNVYMKTIAIAAINSVCSQLLSSP